MIKQTQQSGAAMLIFTLLFTVGSMILVTLLAVGVYRDIIVVSAIHASKQAYNTAHAGVEDVVWRLIDSQNYDPTETVELGGTVATTSLTYDGTIDEYTLESLGDADNFIRQSQMVLSIGLGTSFNFGVQTGNGGFRMENNSAVRGNVFSNGTIEGQGSATIFGDVISGGPTGLIDGVYATGSAYANIIRDSTIDGNAHADLIDGGVVWGVGYYETLLNAPTLGTDPGPGVVDDQATITLPITDDTIEAIKTDVVTNGTVIASTSPECSSGTYTIDFDTTLGFVKIECDVVMRKQGGSTIITLDGPLWIEGNLSFSQGPDIVADASIGARSIPIIVDNEADRITSSQISITNSTNFSGSGSPKSYILLISQNESAELGGSEIAIDFNNAAIGDIIAYAGHGIIDIANSISLKEVTAYRVDIGNGAEISYESGLASVLFVSGPGGGFNIERWNEI